MLEQCSKQTLTQAFLTVDSMLMGFQVCEPHTKRSQATLPKASAWNASVGLNAVHQA